VPKKLKITPLAEESLGVRSMCTLIETPDTTILIDAGASLAPTRMGYPPHPQEYHALEMCRRNIREAAAKAEIVTISHYHFDHHTPSYTDWFTNWSTPEEAQQIYSGKVVLAKSYRSKVNASQRRRGWMFTKTAGSHTKKLETADGKTFTYGETALKFSEPVFHGPENSDLGYLLMLTVECGDEKFMFASDVQGPMCTSTLNIILAENPDLLIIGGPPTYLSGFRVKEADVETGIKNLQTIAQQVPTTILAHHTLRDEKWRSLSQPIFDAAQETGNKVLTAAEYLGRKNCFLELRRKQLYEEAPPSREFENWLSLPIKQRKLVKPPI